MFLHVFVQVLTFSMKVMVFMFTIPHTPFSLFASSVSEFLFTISESSSLEKKTLVNRI